jgi:ketosteroid isomerase-like protein
MMKFKIQLLIVLWLPATLQTQAQHSYMQRLRVINQQIAVAYLHHDPTGLLRIYAGEAVSMPEYHLTLFGKKAIAHYLRKWMDSARVDSYSRQTHDITKVGDYLVETGTFSNKFSLRKKAVDYEGKYLNIWQIKPDGGWLLISEITGAIEHLERSDLPLSTLQIPDTTILAKPPVNATTLAIQSLDDQIAALVVQRRGKDFAKYYTDDAIYMPYYMPMKIGKAAIDAYYREHEDPNTGIDAVHIGATRIIDIGNYALVDGYYKVDWRGGSAHGSVTGKNISVWKRDNSGHLLLFRQMAVHD